MKKIISASAMRVWWNWNDSSALPHQRRLREERGARRTWELAERPSVGHETPPDVAERVLDALDLPQVLEHLEVALHALGIEDRVERGVDLVFEHEDVPAELALRELEHARVKATESGGVVVRGG